MPEIKELGHHFTSILGYSLQKMSVSQLMFVHIMTSFECQDNDHFAFNKMNMCVLIRTICFASSIINNRIINYIFVYQVIGVHIGKVYYKYVNSLVYIS
mgnify:CR=1 FL=1